MFGKKKNKKEDYEDPATKYCTILKQKSGKRDSEKKKSLLGWIFNTSPDSDFVYHED